MEIMGLTIIQIAYAAMALSGISFGIWMALHILVAVSLGKGWQDGIREALFLGDGRP